MGKDEIVKEEILNQAQKLFQQYGLKKTTMDDIAEACHKAKSTLYHYFKSKEEVFDAVVRMEMTSLRVSVKNSVEEQKGTKNKLITYFVKFHLETLNKLNIYRIVKHDMKNENISKDYFIDLMKFEQSYIQRILEDGYDIGEMSDIDREDIPWFAETILAAFFGIVQFSIEKENEFNQERLQRITEVLIPKIFS